MVSGLQTSKKQMRRHIMEKGKSAPTVTMMEDEMTIEPDPSRVQLDLTMGQAELLRDCLFTVAELNVGQRNKILALHEQVMGALSGLKSRADRPRLRDE